MSYPVGRSYVHRRCLGVLTVIVLGQLALTCPLWPSDGPLTARLDTMPWAAFAALCAVSLAWAWRHWWRTPGGWLSWAPDTEASLEGALGSRAAVASPAAGWWWSDANGSLDVPLQPVTAAMGWGRWRLLRVQPLVGLAPVSWIWVEQKALPDRWAALGRALVAHGR